MNQKKEREYPDCNKCGMHKMKVDGSLYCPNCDTKSKPSGIVSRTKDPGMAGFIKKKITGTDGKEYEVMVPAEVKDDSPEEEAPVEVASEPITTGHQVAAIAQQADTVKQHPELLLKALRLVFEQHPARTLGEFKKLKKVRDQIDKLEFLLTTLKG